MEKEVRKKHTLDIETREKIAIFKDSEFYVPILKVLREIEMGAERDVLHCPYQDMERVCNQRMLLEGCRKTLRTFQGVLDRYSNNIGSE